MRRADLRSANWELRCQAAWLPLTEPGARCGASGESTVLRTRPLICSARLALAFKAIESSVRVLRHGNVILTRRDLGVRPVVSGGVPGDEIPCADLICLPRTLPLAHSSATLLA
jgi:hypothetical protein